MDCRGPNRNVRRAAITTREDNTTLGVIATNATLTKVQATKVAQMAHDGFARAISPIHTTADGDTIFVLATGAQTPLAGPGGADATVERGWRARRGSDGGRDRACGARGHGTAGHSGDPRPPAQLTRLGY